MARSSTFSLLKMPKPPSLDDDSRALWGLLSIFAAAALWSVAAVTARHLFDQGLDPIELAEARSFIAVFCLVLIPAARRKRSGGSAVAVITLGLSIALVNAVYYSAIARLDVAVALVLQYTAPALVVGWVAFQKRRLPSTEVALALVITFVGVVLVSGLIGAEVGEVNSAGVAFGLASSVLFATYTLLSERAGAAYGVLGALLRGFSAAALMWILFQIPRGWPADLLDPDNLFRVIYVGVAGTFMPFILFLWGVQQVRAERAAIAATAEPTLAAVIAWVWLGQALTVVQMLGGALVLLGVVALQVRRKEIDVPDL
ncbi:MAG: drug/metabolite transporter, family [Actinomycetota bacterium]|jgi:drug/metabolite transporter (DMT)-like permease|nr:drug/metabolite transporter, family [Actinomycetota bacterium]